MKAKEKKFVANTSNKRETKPKKHKSKAKGSDSIYRLLNMMIR